MSKLDRVGEEGMPGKTNYSKTFTAALLTLLFGVAGAGFGNDGSRFEEISRAIAALSL